MEKIIFLDIDGPMIPNTSFLFHKNPSFDQILDDRCIAVLKKIIEKSGAKIVFNTSHNRLLFPSKIAPGLHKRFLEAGFGENLHEYYHTTYPDVGRLTAIRHWLHEYGTPNLLWVAFDDIPIDHKRAYLTDSNLGIGWGEYQHSARYLQFKTGNSLI